ncbi:NAD(+) synthase [Candidatus Woesearchaeota archaeon]|nr:NAD(+) synthase [Candidatus Woesearchaeota archaeon]
MKTTYYLLLEQIKGWFKRHHHHKAVIGLSGGVDSALCLKLCCDALGAKNVTALMMPEKGLTKEKNIQDALNWAKKLRVKHFLVEINPHLESYHHLAWKQSKIALMNTKARARAVLLYNYANSNNAIVVGTSNKSELMLGYGTKYGDLASDVMIIGDLLKTEIMEISRYLKLPPSIIRKRPSAELTVGQTDEADLGASYSKLDSILKRVLKGEKLNKKDNLVKKTLQRIEKQKHKRGPVPVLELKE